MHSASLAQRKSDHSRHFLNVWNWDNQFDEDIVSLFYNPLYRVSAERRGSEGQCWTFPRHVSNAVGAMQRHLTAPNTPTCLSESVLWPRHHMPNLHVWSLCYLRWLTPVQIVNGGSPAELIAQQALLSDIEAVQQDIARLSGQQTVSSRRPGHGQQHDMSVRLPQPQHVSSSYPFAACQPSLHTTRLTGYSTARLSYSEDSISVDELSVTDVSHSEL